MSKKAWTGPNRPVRGLFSHPGRFGSGRRSNGWGKTVSCGFIRSGSVWFFLVWLNRTNPNLVYIYVWIFFCPAHTPFGPFWNPRRAKLSSLHTSPSPFLAASLLLLLQTLAHSFPCAATHMHLHHCEGGEPDAPLRSHIPDAPPPTCKQTREGKGFARQRGGVNGWGWWFSGREGGAWRCVRQRRWQAQRLCAWQAQRLCSWRWTATWILLLQSRSDEPTAQVYIFLTPISFFRWKMLTFWIIVVFFDFYHEICVLELIICDKVTVMEHWNWKSFCLGLNIYFSGFVSVFLAQSFIFSLILLLCEQTEKPDRTRPWPAQPAPEKRDSSGGRRRIHLFGCFHLIHTEGRARTRPMDNPD